MSLVNHRAQNHPQQVAARGPQPAVDDRAIRDEDWLPLHRRFQFTIDAAASPHNAKLPRYWTEADDALSQSWVGERIWCNPPYSRLMPWVHKAQMSWSPPSLEGWPTAEVIVMLVPANRSEQPWWQTWVEPYRGERHPGWGLHVEFLPGRMRFDRPSAVIGPKGDRPPFGCCLLIWERP